MAVPSTEEILAQGGGSPVVIDGVLYQPIFDSTGQGETFEQGPLTQVVAYKPGETATGQAYKTYSPDMQEIGKGEFKDVGNFGDLLTTAAEDLAPLATMALTMGGAGGLLGSALTGGSLSATASSALGNALIAGASGALTGQDPLKAALLAAGGTYAGGLFGDAATVSDAQFIAADAAQLAAQGLGADQIEQVLRASGVNTTAAIIASDAAASGNYASEIERALTTGNKGGLFTDSAKVSTPATVTTDPLTGLQTATATGSLASPVVNAGGLLGGLTAAVPAAVTAGGNIVSSPLSPLNQSSQISVTGERAPEFNLGDILATIDPSLIGPSVGPQPPSEQVVVSGTAQPKTAADDLAAAIAATVNPATVATTTPASTADQKVEVTGTKATDTKNLPATITALDTVVSPGPDVGPQKPADQVIETTGTKNKDNLPATITAIDTVVSPGPDVGPQSGGDVETQDQKDRTTNPNALLGGLTLADLLKAFTTISSLGMLGGGGGGGGGGTTTMAPTTPVPVGNADYYKSIQQYYNTYMPQTPRDVATPLQQWYEGKFGG